MSSRTLVLTALCALPLSASAADTGVDLSFAQSGWRRMFESGGGTQDEKAAAFARTADGGYVIAAELPGGGADGGTGKRIGLFRLDRDGNYVTSGFGDSGKVVKDAWLTSVTDMTVDAQGRIVVVGGTPGQGGVSDFGVVRFDADGSDDASFAGDGGTSFGFDVTGLDTEDAPTSVLVDPDGRIVVAGNVRYSTGEHRFGVVRFDVDGTQDSTFGNVSDGHGGFLGTEDKFANGRDAYASRILHIAGGYYVVAGTSVYSGTDTDFAARILTPSGGPWADFVGSVAFPIDVPGSGGSLFDNLSDAILVDPTTILLVGSASGRFAATRIKAGTENGSSQYTTLTADPTFTGHPAGADCDYCYVGSTTGSSGESAAVRSDGRILLVGDTSSFGVSGAFLDGIEGPAGNTFSHAGLVTRLNPDGTPDSGFGINGSYLIVAPSSGSQSYHTEFKRVRFDGPQPVILGSAVDSLSSVTDFDAVITRLNADQIFADGFESVP
ncbi:hypothetical protein [Dokdonella sp.]|uniref:hypothetical protein n=1 Tax=Dokdonella sp. TaxID=2291710 RepID=UPI001B05CA3D|nr:hypothetical protein [Dokdonella sp.]MBO9662962.1 hypothetical protein [Dokdonella sp.]